MIGTALFILLIFVFIALTGGTGQKQKTKPPSAPEPTRQDKAMVEWLWGQFGGAIATLTDSGKSLLIDRIKSSPDKSIK